MQSATAQILPKFSAKMYPQAHSALYDTERTAVLFCEIVNRWKRLGGWPLPTAEEV